MASETESLAVQLVRDLYDATHGKVRTVAATLLDAGQ
jgi:hypothetical protein